MISIFFPNFQIFLSKNAYIRRFCFQPNFGSTTNEKKKYLLSGNKSDASLLNGIDSRMEEDKLGSEKNAEA